MPLYLFWGEDDFALVQAVHSLRQDVLDPTWIQFNFNKITGSVADATVDALNQAMTPAFGSGGRLIWLVDTAVCQQCSEELLSQLERTLPNIPQTSHLLLTTSRKPDKRIKSTKLLHKYAQIREFPLIPPWKTEALDHKVQQMAKEAGVKLTAAAVKVLAESVGNNSRQLWNELEKLSIYGHNQTQPLDAEVIATLVNANTQNSIQLATAIRTGKQAEALQLVTQLIDRNEPALRIVATLVGQFRTWIMVKLMIEREDDEKAIALAAEVGNPKRIYFLRKEVNSLSSQQLLATLPVLLDLELNLKQGAEPLSTLQTKVIELCRFFHTSS